MPDLDSLLNAGDLAKFASSDQSWWLAAAGRAIRDYCGWHVFPSVALTGAKVRCGERGLVILPSKWVTAVNNLVVDGSPLVLDVDYYWQPADPTNMEGYGNVIQRRSYAYPRNPYATVDYTHGYPTLPEDVAAVGYELVQQGRSRPGSNAKDLGAGPYRVQYLKTGNSLDDDQKRRLREAGVVRAGIA